MSTRRSLAGQALLAALTVGLLLISHSAATGFAQTITADGGTAAVTWPASEGLVVGEVVTRGAAASDQYVEIYNAAAAPRPLDNVELVYVTASGATVTRKASWTSGSLAAGQRLLVVNAAGAYAALGDATFSGGFSTLGGSLVLRLIDGAVIDALSWGTASSAFVEGSPGPAPPTGRGLERQPGAGAGNWIDTNDNLADTWLNATPVAENLDSPAAPRPAQGIAALRGLPLGTSVTISGRLTTPPVFEDGRGAFVQDDFGGIAVLSDSEPLPLLAVGSAVGAQGVLERHFGLLVLHLASAADMWWDGDGATPAPVETSISDIGEALEAVLVRLEGEIVSVEPSDDGLRAVLVDGSGMLTVIAPAVSATDPALLLPGDQLALTGVIGRHDVDPQAPPAYLLYLRSADDIMRFEPEPSPAPIPSPAPTPAPTASATPAASATPSPTATPISVVAIADARQRPLGSAVSVQGTVTAVAGRILGDRTLAIQDDSGGICVRLADDHLGGLARGQLISVTGELAAPYGNLEVRPSATGVVELGSVAQPAPRAIEMAELGEEVEGLLVRVEGTLRRIDTGAGTLTLIVADGSGEGRIFIHAPLGLSKSAFHTGQQLRVTGIAGDRLGLYRVWPADATDIVALPDDPPSGGGGGGGGGGGSPTPTPAASAAVVTIARALTLPGQAVTVEGFVTVGPGLIDADGRRIVIQDSTAALLVRLPAAAGPPAVGRRIRITGSVGSYYNAPQLAASDPPQLLGSATVAPVEVRGAPLGAALEWRLVRVSGSFDRVTRSGDTWRAEFKLASGSIPVIGLARSNIVAPTSGRPATVVGVVRRAYPTATDQRFALAPRSAADISFGIVQPYTSASPSVGGPVAPGEAGAPNDRPADGSGTPLPVVGLAQLGDHIGSAVRIGGRIVGFDGARLMLADESGRGTIRLGPQARAALASLQLGDVINATGTVVIAGAGVELVVDRAEDMRRAPTVTGPTAQPTSVPSPVPLASDAAIERTVPEGNPGIGWLSLLALGALSGMVAVRIARRRLDPHLLISRFLANRRGRVRI